MLTMGLALLIFVLKSIYLRNGDGLYNKSARFWGKIFAVTFVMGVVTGIPLEFQFGTNWAAFSRFAGVIIATNAWVQHPVGYKMLSNGNIELNNYWAVLLNSWTFAQYAHNMGGAVVCGAFVMAGLGAFYVLGQRHEEYGQIFLKVGITAGVIASLWMLFPSGHFSSDQVAKHQPVSLAAMEGLFRSERQAGIVLVGQPDIENKSIENPIVVPRALSYLVYQNWNAEVKGLDAFPKKDWPQNIPLLYYSYHVMVGLGTIFISIMVVAAFLLWRGLLYRARWMLWILMLAMPFPFIANTAGWFTAELGRQPWLAYGLFRTSEGVSPLVSSGSVLFTLIGFAGMYLIMGLLYIVLMVREVVHGPEGEEEAPEATEGLTA